MPAFRFSNMKPRKRPLTYPSSLVSNLVMWWAQKVGAFTGEDVALLSLLFTNVAPLFRSTQIQSSSSVAPAGSGGLGMGGLGGGSETPSVSTSRSQKDGLREEKGAEE